MAVARPIRFVYLDDNGKFQVDPEAMAVLQLVKEPVGVVSVCGRAHQGKSYILNQILGRSSGFQVAATHRPCTKGIWLWSEPLKRNAPDTTFYSWTPKGLMRMIIRLDSCETYSTQIISLAVLLSSLFIYNQMGGIDEAALDRLSLVTEVMKHIHIHDSAGNTTTSELGQFSPNFVWLFRDFCLDLVEDNRIITPRDYLELALTSAQDGAVNEIRESIRALFPDRECFTLVRPLSNENDLQRLDQISMEYLQPEFKSGVDALTRFVSERTHPKQVGATVVTGPIFARITQSFLDSLNMGVVPTITLSRQSVEEAECQRAFDMAGEAYMSSFDHSNPPNEAALREAHEVAVQEAVIAFNSTAVGDSSIRQKYEKRLQTFTKKAFEVVSTSSSLLYSLNDRSQMLDIKQEAYREDFITCSNFIENMKRELRNACHPYAELYDVLKILDRLVTEYYSTCHGPEKLKKLTNFLQQSMKGPIHDLVKKQTDQLRSEKSSLALKCRRNEDKVDLLQRQLTTAERQKSEYLKLYEDAISDESSLAMKCRRNEDKVNLLQRELTTAERQKSEYLRLYEDAISDKSKLSDDYHSRIASLLDKCSLLEERCREPSKLVDSAKQESREWKWKYEQLLSRQKAEKDQAFFEIQTLKSKCDAAEARLAAAGEKSKLPDYYESRIKMLVDKCSSLEEKCKSTSKLVDSAKQESSEWKKKYEQILSRQKAEKDQSSLELQMLKSKSQAAGAKLAAAEKQAQSAREEAEEWKRKYNSAVKERTNKQTQLGSDFSHLLDKWGPSA